MFHVCFLACLFYRFVLYVLHGPPGTGKTRVIASTVRCLLEMDPDIRILLTTPSNMAADILALKLMEQFDGNVMGEHNVLRLRSIGNDFLGRNKKLDPISTFDSVAEVFTIPKAAIFNHFRVVICTLGCSTHIINQNIPPGFFTHIFLDEAGQTGEAEIWIPLGGLATKDTSVILCGDHNQLGPVYTLDLPSRVTRKFDSALVRYTSMPCYNIDKRVFCVLKRSYRCHRSILEIASLLFYSQNLKSGLLYRYEPFEDWPALPKKGFPVFFVNVDGRQIMEEGSKSYANMYEIPVVFAYVQRILHDYDIDPLDIGIISPYRFQTSLLNSELERRRISPRNRKIIVDSVERFQGSERKVIIMTTTRTNGLGFVGCDLRGVVVPKEYGVSAFEHVYNKGNELADHHWKQGSSISSHFLDAVFGLSKRKQISDRLDGRSSNISVTPPLLSKLSELLKFVGLVFKRRTFI